MRKAKSVTQLRRQFERWPGIPELLDIIEVAVRAIQKLDITGDVVLDDEQRDLIKVFLGGE